MKKTLITVVVIALLILVPTGVAQAATSQDVTVTAKPVYVSISNTPATRDFGNVGANVTYWSLGANTTAPSFPLAEADCYFSVNNTSSANITVSIRTFDPWTGGIGWSVNNTATPGVDVVGLKAGYWSPSGNTTSEVAMVIIKYSAAFNDLYTTTSTGEDFKWEFKLLTPTEFGDSVQKEGIIRLTATAS